MKYLCHLLILPKNTFKIHKARAVLQSMSYICRNVQISAKTITPVGVTELVDTPASGVGARNGMEARILFRAPVFAKITRGVILAKTPVTKAQGSDRGNILEYSTSS
jgi:hypothetical protein